MFFLFPTSFDGCDGCVRSAQLSFTGENSLGISMKNDREQRSLGIEETKLFSLCTDTYYASPFIVPKSSVGIPMFE